MSKKTKNKNTGKNTKYRSMSPTNSFEIQSLAPFLLGFAVSASFYDESIVTQFLKWLTNTFAIIYTLTVFLVLSVLYIERMVARFYQREQSVSHVVKSADQKSQSPLKMEATEEESRNKENAPRKSSKDDDVGLKINNVDSDTTATEDISSDGEEFDAEEAVPSSPRSELINLNGIFRLEKNENFQEFLASQGVGWALRAAADKAVTTHHITHTEKELKIKVAGIISSETVYPIDGRTIVRTKIKDREYEDTVTYTEDGAGVRVTKVCKGHNYKVFVVRRFSPDKDKLIVTSTAEFPTGKKVQCNQYYRRIEKDK